MLKAYKDFWKRYADFEGVTSRPDYWWAFLCNAIVNAVLIIISTVVFIGTIARYETENPGAIASMTDMEAGQFAVEVLAAMAPILIVCLIWWLVTLVPNLAIQVRRLRDAGFHWSLILLNLLFLLFFVPILNILIMLGVGITFVILFCQPTKVGQTVAGTPVTPVTVQPQVAPGQMVQPQQVGQPQQQVVPQQPVQPQMTQEQVVQPQAVVQPQQQVVPQQSVNPQVAPEPVVPAQPTADETVQEPVSSVDEAVPTAVESVQEQAQDSTISE